ncbi:hypothetical protein CFC21_060956 [Triticum aestivum]|uniref:Peptidase A1 domain-containing protein n=4 Tax=Triticinae TaxID=1648030 RepID=A0A453HK13_AEGTS|nr:aspartic proteinase nepenthesin-2 [Aegilops tauschii subsp. strangulata]XP_044377716.1 aspartic proteinase nepenthesin-2-like [Triticum aestivum]KAF7052937.1 hypothetical protein CFC21_060956 [Triticum aestivum]
MGRSSGSLAVAMTTLVASVLILQLLLAPAPVSSSPAVLVPLLRTAVIRASPLLRNLVKAFLKEQAKQGVMELMWKAAGHLKNQLLGGVRADAAGLVVFDISIGTSPAQVISGVMDITSQLVWAQCAPCDACRAPAFRPADSASFSKIPCGSPTCPGVLGNATACVGDGDCAYNATYYGAGNQSNAYTHGSFATETFTFGATSVPGIVFGCVASSTVELSGGASALFGFGRGNISLVSQLGLSRFSYTLASDDADGSESVIRLGDAAVPQTQGSRSTPLLRSVMQPDLYYVGLSSIQVDGHDLDGIPAGTFDLQADGSGGVFLSSTWPATYLEETAYGALRRALVSSIESQGVTPVDAEDLHQLCYRRWSFSDVTVPALTLVFDGVNATMEVKPENYFFKDGLKVCLTVLPSKGGSVLGSLLQTGTNMIFDIAGGLLTFETPTP